MPLLAVSIALPADLVEVRSGDVDRDGKAELVLMSRLPQADKSPDRARLTTLWLDPSGKELRRGTLDLGQRALYWDIDGGLYGLDGKGLLRLDPMGGAEQRLLELKTPLSALGRTTPAQADFLRDLNRDGLPELVYAADGRLKLLSVDGTPWGEVEARAEGALSSTAERGGVSLVVTSRQPEVAFGDVDGDGREELMLPRGERCKVYFLGPGVTPRTAELRLPLDIDPREDPTAQPGKERKELDNVYFRDVDLDGKVDLVAHQWVHGGTWWGATAELLWARGTGSGFGNPQILRTPNAAWAIDLVDQDGDGDLDLTIPQVDLGMGNIGRAPLSQQVRVEGWLYTMAGGRYSEQPVVIREMDWPISDPESLEAILKGDMDGDGALDLVVAGPKGSVAVWGGRKGGKADRALGTMPLPAALRHPEILMADLTGDGRAEALIWAPGVQQGLLLRLSP